MKGRAKRRTRKYSTAARRSCLLRYTCTCILGSHGRRAQVCDATTAIEVQAPLLLPGSVKVRKPPFL